MHNHVPLFLTNLCCRSHFSFIAYVLGSVSTGFESLSKKLCNVSSCCNFTQIQYGASMTLPLVTSYVVVVVVVVVVFIVAFFVGRRVSCFWLAYTLAMRPSKEISAAYWLTCKLPYYAENCYCSHSAPCILRKHMLY